MKIRSYSKIFNLGHNALESLFIGNVVVSEKIDGSQISFAVQDGELHCRSKGQELLVVAPEKMFQKGIDAIHNLFEKGLLNEGWTYRGEFLRVPKHNTLEYARIPKNHIILFDIDRGFENYMSPIELAAEAEKIGLESVPLMYQGPIEKASEVFKFLERESILGEQKIEGVVIKNYIQYGPDKKALMGKHVSEKFKEIHGKEWKKNNPAQRDVVMQICDRYTTEARWQKAVQHMKERGELLGEPKDIGALMKEVQQDILEECQDEIKQILFKWAWKQIERSCTRGLPTWYKNELVKKQFED